MHPLIRFASKNLRKSAIRSSLSILAVFLGVLLITTLLVLTDSLVATVDDSLDVLSGVIVVQQENAVDPNFSIIDREVVKSLVSANQSGGALDGLIDEFVEEIWYVEKNDEGLFGFMQVIGLLPSKERSTVGVLAEDNIIKGRTLEDTDFNASVIGSTVAFAMGVGIGDYITVAGRDIEIVGIFFTDSFVDSTIFIPYTLAKEFSPQFSSGDYVSTILIKPRDLQAGEAIINYVNNELSSSYPVEASDFEEIAEEGRKFLNITTDFAFYIGLISIIIGSLSVFNAILMSVMERKGEIAILKATGWSDREVAIEVFVESLIIALIGGIAGLIGGVGISFWFTSRSDLLNLVILPVTLMRSFVFAVILGIFAGSYPAIRAMRIDPVIDISG